MRILVAMGRGVSNTIQCCVAMILSLELLTTSSIFSTLASTVYLYMYLRHLLGRQW